MNYKSRDELIVTKSGFEAHEYPARRPDSDFSGFLPRTELQCADRPARNNRCVGAALALLHCDFPNSLEDVDAGEFEQKRNSQRGFVPRVWLDIRPGLFNALY